MLELKLKKREREKLTAEDMGVLEATEVGRVTSKVKEKLIMELKKRKEAKTAIEKKLKEF